MKSILTTLSILLCICVVAQPTDYNIAITGGSGSAFNCIVHLPSDYWSRPNTDSFPGKLWFPGVGEQGTDSSVLAKNGPHNAIRNGVYGGNDTLNGVVYPTIIISIQPTGSFSPAFMKPKIDAIMSMFRIKRNSLHVMGMSQGGYWSNNLATHQETLGDYSYINRINSVVNIQGVPPDDNWGQTPAFATRMRYFALYGCYGRGGRELGIWQTGDGERSMPKMADTMNSVVPGSFKLLSTSYTPAPYHSFWWRYWGGKSSNTNQENVTTAPYRFNINGRMLNVYEWTTVQSDTQNVVHYALSGNTSPSVSAGVNQTAQLPISSVYLFGSASDPDGSITSYSWSKISGPGSPTILNASSDTTKINGLQEGTTVFRLFVTDNGGATAYSDVTVTTLAEPAHNYDRYSLGEYQAFIINSSDILFGLSVGQSAVGTGNSTGYAVPPVQVAINETVRSVGSGLHHSLASTYSGKPYAWGWNEMGQAGQGATSSQIYTPVQITRDSAGNTLPKIVQVSCGYSFNAYSFSAMVSEDGRLFLGGVLKGGLRGNGTEGDTAKYFVELVIPGKRLVKKAIAGEILYVLCTDGSAWTCGGGGSRIQNLGRGNSGVDYKTIGQVVNMPAIIDIAGAGQFSYGKTSAGVLWGFGYFGCYLSVGSGGYANNTPVATARDLTTDLSLPGPVDEIATNTVSTHVTVAGALYGWGDNANGTIGNGQGLNWATYPTPYAWDLGPGQLLVQDPVRILSQYSDFTHIYGGQSYVFYKYAQRSNGKMYAWGRNKTGTIANGIVGPNSAIIAAYPNSWDVVTPVEVSPFTLTGYTIQQSPYCLANPSGSPCSTYSPPVNPTQAIPIFKFKKYGKIKILSY